MFGGEDGDVAWEMRDTREIVTATWDTRARTFPLLIHKTRLGTQLRSGLRCPSQSERDLKTCEREGESNEESDPYLSLINAFRPLGLLVMLLMNAITMQPSSTCRSLTCHSSTDRVVMPRPQLE